MNTMATLGGCVYVTVRGFSNIAVGVENKRKAEEKKKVEQYERALALKAADRRHQMMFAEEEPSEIDPPA
jgi:hypothetical protein